jgi:hypothetical protein
VRRIANHNFPDHAMKTDCTHVCIYRLTDAEGGEKRYCNKPLKLFRSADLLYANMFKVLSDMLNAELFCELVLSCLKLVVSDIHVSLKAEEIRMLVMLRMNRGFMEYMRASYPDTPLSEFKAADTYVRAHGDVGGLDDDEDDEDDE